MVNPRTYRSFLLSAWQEQTQEDNSEAVWRYGVEDTRGNNRRRVFLTLEEVMEHVKGALDEEND